MLSSKVLPSMIAGAVVASAPAFSQEGSLALKEEASVPAFGAL